MRKPYPLYVATDTDEVVELLRLAARDDQFRIVVADNQLRYNFTGEAGLDIIALSYKTDNVTQHSRELLTDMMMLWRATAFIGTLNSNIGRVVSELRQGERCTLLDIETQRQWLQINDTDLAPYVDRRSLSIPQRSASPLTQTSLSAPLAAYWPSFFGLFPEPKPRTHEEQMLDNSQFNPLWW
jgi:hypothetical protein